MTSDKWLKVPNFDGYEVSNLGRVRSTDRDFKMADGRAFRRKGRILKDRNNKGYRCVHLSINGKDCQVAVHRLVALAFLPNPNGYKEVNHKDETRDNNCVDNLEWCDRKHNANYGTLPERVSERLSKAVISTDSDGNETYFDSIRSAAEKFNGSAGNICAVLTGKTHTAWGLKWRYAND